MTISSLTFAYTTELIKSSDNNESEQAKIFAESKIPLSLQYQHKDTVMLCIAMPPCVPGAHLWNDSAGPDGNYGTADDCPHCSAYCAPASISMISIAYRMPAINTQQDDIYDNGKQTFPEIMGSGILETHGVGMFDGSGARAPEVQTSLLWALQPGGIGFIQHDWMGAPGGPLTPALLQGYIQNWQPVLWLDHSGWPVNQSINWPPSDARPDQGHAKVIAGYNDNGTIPTSDDICLIYDPWPEYNDKSILPVNATKGPGNTFDPYWLPLNDVNLSDLNDIYLVPMIAIPEFSVILIPIIGVMILAVIAMRWNTRERSE